MADGRAVVTTVVASPPIADGRPQDSDPLWSQVAGEVRRGIDRGEYPPHTRLPSERELCERFEISRVTLRKALTSLVADKVISSSHGRGWYVNSRPVSEQAEWPSNLESFSETAARLSLTATSTVLDCSISGASLDEAEALLIAPGTTLFRLQRIRMLDLVPIAIDSSIVPAGLVPGFTTVDFRSESLYVQLTRVGFDLSRADSTIEAREADGFLASHLGVEPGKPVLVLKQTVRDANDRPVLKSTVQYVGDRYRLRTHFVRATIHRRPHPRLDLS